MQKPLIRGVTAFDKDGSNLAQDEESGLVVPRSRARALSTGSIDNTAHDDPLIMDTSADTLLFTSIPASKPHLPPKPRRKVSPLTALTNDRLIDLLVVCVVSQAPLVPPNKPQRPPPPVKPSGARSEGEPTKDKAEVQAHIRSLKENNSALTEINGHLEDKLFKVLL